MAAEQGKEGNEKKEKKQPWYRFPLKTNIKRLLDWAGFPVHDVNETGVRNMRVFIDLREELEGFEAIKVMNQRMTELEAEWEGAGDDASKAASAAGFREKFEELFSAGADDPESKINSSIGPFTDLLALSQEVNWVTNGTGTKKESFDINIDGNDIKCEYSVPEEKELAYNDGRKFTMAFVGYRNPQYLPLLQSEIQKILDNVEQAYKNSRNLDTGQKAVLKNNLNSIKESVATMVADAASRINSRETEHYGNIGGTTGVLKFYNELQTDINNLLKLRLNFEKVYYQHTYKVITPEVYVNGVLQKLKDVPGWYKRDDEAAHGLDKNGWPLEVGDGSTLFENAPLKEGIVLLDLYNKDDKEYQKLQKNQKIRQVPKHFISDWSILDVAVWIYVSYDAYRDDLRDARYHEKAISVMERILADINVVDMDFDVPKNLLRGEHIKAKMKLNKSQIGNLRPSSDPAYIDVEIGPSHLNPAFDTRAFKFKDPNTGKPMPWNKHLGRKLYYDVQDNSEQSNDPTITTRGAALYILHRLIERCKYWDGKGDEKKAGVIQLIDEITREIGGWDIGPNIAPGAARWGKPLTKNPFIPQQPGN